MNIIPKRIEAPEAPPQNETYSQAMQLGDLIYVSGQLGVRPEGTLPDAFSDQVRQAIQNIATVLKAANSALDLVAKVNIYITDFSRLAEMNRVYSEFFRHRPAKTTVEVVRLDRGAQIEIEVVAATR